MRKKSLLMALLVLLVINLFSSTVYSVVINDLVFYGKDNIPNVFDNNRNDESITLLSKITSDNLDTDKLFLDVQTFGIHYPLRECNIQCTQEMSQYTCSCDLNWAPTGKITLSLSYENTLKSSTLYPDELPPEIDVNLYQEGDKIKGDYSLSDSACPTCGSVCAGLDKITIYDEDNTKLYEENLDGSCSESNNLEFNYNKDGHHRFKIIVSDRMNHESRTYKEVDTDFTLPVIKNLELYKNDEPIEYIGNSISDAHVKFTIKEENLRRITVYLSDIGNNNDIKNALPNQYCFYLNDEYNCDFLANINTPDINLRVVAYDNENSNEVTLTKTIKKDDEPPEIKSLRSNLNYENKNYIGKYAIIHANIKEDKSGISKDNIYLDASDLGYSRTIPSDSCTPGWDCSWKIEPKKRKSAYYLYVLKTSTDNSGNYIIGDNRIKLYPDFTDPEIINVSIRGVNNNGEFPYYQSGDIIKAVVYLRENEGIGNATLNFSDNIYQSKCDNINSSIYRCYFETSPVEGGYYDAKLYFYFTDYGGNVVKDEETIVIFGLLNDRPDNYIVNTYGTVPKEISRLTSRLVDNYKISVPFSVDTNSRSMHILRYEIKNCKLDNDTAAFEDLFMPQTQYPIPLFLPLTQSGVKNYAEFLMRELTYNESLRINNTLLTCDVEIYERKGNRVFTEPEIDQLSAKLIFTDATITGTPGEELYDKIEKAKKNLFYKMKWASKASNIAKKFEKVCNVGKSMVSLWGTFSLIEGIGLGLKKVPYIGNTVGEAIFDTGCYSYEILGKWIVMPIWYGSGLDNGFDTSNCGEKFSKGVSGINPSVQKKVLKLQAGYGNYIGDQSKVFEKGLWPGLRWMCGFISCEYGTRFADTVKRATGGDIFKDLGLTNINLGSYGYVDLTTDNLRIDPRDSMAMSIMTMCFTGMLYNLDKWRKVQCEYINCLTNTAKTGGDINICEKLHDEAICLTWRGELVNSIGFLKLLRNIDKQIVKIASDLLPNTLKWVIDKAICKNPKVGEKNQWMVVLACDVPRAYYALQDTLGRLKELKNAKDTINFNFKDEDDVCKDVK